MNGVNEIFSTGREHDDMMSMSFAGSKMVPARKIRETPRAGLLSELRAERQRRQQLQRDSHVLQAANDRLVEMCCFLLRHRPPSGKELAAQWAMGTSVDEAAIRKASLASEFEFGRFWGWFADVYGNGP